MGQVATTIMRWLYDQADLSHGCNEEGCRHSVDHAVIDRGEVAQFVSYNARALAVGIERALTEEQGLRERQLRAMMERQTVQLDLLLKTPEMRAAVRTHIAQGARILKGEVDAFHKCPAEGCQAGVIWVASARGPVEPQRCEMCQGVGMIERSP